MTIDQDHLFADNQPAVEPRTPPESQDSESGRKSRFSRPYVQVTYSCGGCDTRWPGINRAHCSGCHRTWSGPSMFDQHRRDVRGVGTCIDPATIKGQMLVDGVWRSDKERAPGTYSPAES